MLLRKTTNSGPVLYCSPLLTAAEVPHGFSTRIGGSSPPPFDSLNLGNPNGCEIQDDTERIANHYRLLQQAVGCAGRELCRVHQVHGAGIVHARRGEPFDCSERADAIVSGDASRVLSVRVADCVPVILAGEGGRVVAAVHAGWRGVVGGVVVRALAEMQESYSVREASIVAAIGPSIGRDAFEVGEEVAGEFERLFGAEAPVRRHREGKALIDLREAIRLQLIMDGVSAERIDSTDRCTYRDREEFFSHRRDNGITGRMAAVVGCKAS